MPRIAEIFSSIAGEGAWMGRPAVFIRFSGCNLSCEWCDEKHARTGGTLTSMEEIIEECRRSGLKRVVVTGGEPLLQKEDCVSLVKKLMDVGFKVMIETNGTLLNRLSQEERAILRCCEITVSPKKGHLSGNAVRTAMSLSAQFKFVVGGESWSCEEVREIVEKYSIDRENVWLMPLSVNGVIEDDLARTVWDFCVKEGYNYSDRLHVRVWKGEKGR